MKTLRGLAFLLLLSIPLSAGQSSTSSSVAELPPCALNCLLLAIEQSPCSPTNQTCLCANEPLQQTVTTCVTQGCTVKEALVAKNITTSDCGVPIRDRSKLYSNLAIGFAVTSAALVLLRLGYKILASATELGLDDYFVLITLLVGVPSTVLNVRGLAANGIGRDVWTLTPTQITDFVHVFYFMEILYFAEVALLKLSFLFFYLRIFLSRPVRRLLWATITFDCLYGTAFVLTAIFQCRPINYYWHEWDGEHSGQCININALGWSNAIISIVLDIWMLAIPIHQLMHLQMHWKKKVAVGLMFCVGTFVTVVSVLRLQSLVAFAKSSNPTWDQWQVSNWSTIEITVGIMCTCMPAVRLILVNLFPKIMGLSSSRKEYSVSEFNSRSANRSGNHPFALEASAPVGLHELGSKSGEMYRGRDDDQIKLVPT